MAPPCACPICSRHFRTENLALHVEACLQKSSADERRRQRAQELATPLFPLAPPPPASAKSKNVDSQLQSARRHSFPTTTSASVESSSRLSNGASTASPTNATPLQSKKRCREAAAKASAPLAERMRPTSLDALVGQEELLGPGKLLSSLIQADRVPNMILWGCVRGCRAGYNELGRGLAAVYACAHTLLAASSLCLSLSALLAAAKPHSHT